MNYKIIGKYIKKLNFNIPKPEVFFLLSKDISNYKINIDIKSSPIKQNIIEVNTALALNPVREDFEKIDTKIIYSTIIELKDSNISKEEIEKIILIMVPAEIYSELRQIFVFLFQNSGFKDVKINKSVDFEKLYKLRKIQ
jgi:preprotein translocase subunit SecB